MTRRYHLGRREFLTTTGAALGTPYLIPSGCLAGEGKPGANDRLTAVSYTHLTLPTTIPSCR